MYTLLLTLLTLVVFVLAMRGVVIAAPKIKFYLTGLDFGFSILEIRLLWELSKTADLKEPTGLFWSIPCLDRCIQDVLLKSEEPENKNDGKLQLFLQKLYKYRTKVQLDPSNASSMKTTKSLEEGQRLRIVLHGSGVFSATVIHVGREIIISMPIQKKQILIFGKDWVGSFISVYLFRKNDAAYVFDTTVLKTIEFNGQNSLALAHSESLLRTQKRKSVRCETQIYGQMFVQKSETMNHVKPEVGMGLKCYIEDISEDGALIRAGGKGKAGIALKLQYNLEDRLIVMYGIIKSVEYNKSIHQSRMHFECFEVTPSMKNAILSYVYKLLPQKEKDEYDAITLAGEDSLLEELEPVDDE